MLKLTCDHLEMHELKKCRQKQSESGLVCMTSTLMGYYILKAANWYAMDHEYS